MPATAIVFASMIVPRRMLEASRFLDVPALVAAAGLRASGVDVVVVDALASTGASVTAVGAGELRVGLDDERLVARLPADATRVYVVATPFHAEDDLRTLEVQIAARAPGAAITVGLPTVEAVAAPAWDLVDVGAYLALQREIVGDDAGLPLDVMRDGTVSLDALASQLTTARARGADAVVVTSDLVSVDAALLGQIVACFAQHRFAFSAPRGPSSAVVTIDSLPSLAGATGRVDLQVEPTADTAHLSALLARGLDAGVALRARFDVGGPGATAQDVNAVLERAVALFDGQGLRPHLVAQPGGLSAAELEDFLWTFDERVTAGEGPKKVIMNVTYRCNNRCTFCATGTRTQVDGNYERQRELLVKYRDLGVRLLDFDGGEPTLNEKLFELVGFARRLGYEKVNVTTNARMASYPAYAERLVRSGVTSVLVSIHGPDAQTHAQNVGVAEAFDQTCEGARNIVAAAPKHVELGANITLTKSNHKKLEQVAELVLSLGLKWFNLQFLTPFGRATSSVSPDTQEAANVAMRVIDKYRDRIRFQVINLPFCFMPGYEEFLLGDLLKLERHMLFVNNDEVNLFEYLRERRTKKPVCETCPRAVFCGGFYELEDVPEPTWLVRPEDLVRPIRAEVPSAGA